MVANDDINLKFYKGKTLGLVGESGCGKSTFMRFLVSLDTPSEGEILYRGKDITKLKGEELRQNRQNIQMVFQDPTSSFNPKMKIRDIVCEPLMNFNRIRKSEKDAACRRLLEMVELPGDFADRYPHNMSGGQRQRICIARALALNPEFVVCDEPVSALDVSVQAQIINLLKELQEKRNLTYLFISHDLSVVEHISDTIGVMYLGGLVETGTTADIFANPQSEVAKELIRKDTGSDIDADSRLDAGREKGQAEIKSGEKIRIVFSENSAFEPVIANLILTFGEPVNILKADTKNVGGVAKGEMILGVYGGQYQNRNDETVSERKRVSNRGR